MHTFPEMKEIFHELTLGDIRGVQRIVERIVFDVQVLKSHHKCDKHRWRYFERIQKVVSRESCPSYAR